MSATTSIAHGSVVRFHYRLTDGEGEEVDTSHGDEPMTYLHGFGNLVPGLERQLADRVAGDKLTAIVPPEEGYGVRQEDPGMRVPLTEFPSDVELEAGLVLAATTESGENIPVWVIAVEDEFAILTQQHPLAGVTLHFEVEIIDVRPGTPEELGHGHAHGEGGEEC